MAVPIAVLGIVVALITPLPGFLLDLLIVTDILVSVTVMMVSLYLVRPVEFTSFPTTLLLLTLFRLALNVSSSRLILLNGNTGTSAAGEVIGAFGSFVVGGNYVIGAVIFLVLIAIQYVVINHGAVRISEVTARFTLDALPGKQMSIDSDLNTGLIDEVEAKRRRKQLSTEAEFYGAMDGASRFTQRDAMASILITGINIVAGFLIGVLQHGMDFRKALETYTVLTIGDGLVTVIPALMISISGALIVTRASSDAQLGAEFHRQILRQLAAADAGGRRACWRWRCCRPCPSCPSVLHGRRRRLCGLADAPQGTADRRGPCGSSSSASQREFGSRCCASSPWPSRSAWAWWGWWKAPRSLRCCAAFPPFASSLPPIWAICCPPVRVTDNLSLRSREYVISLKGVEISRYELPQGCELAIPTRPNRRANWKASRRASRPSA